MSFALELIETARREGLSLFGENLQDVQELSNFFERRLSAYRAGVTGEVSFDDEF